MKRRRPARCRRRRPRRKRRCPTRCHRGEASLLRRAPRILRLRAACQCRRVRQRSQRQRHKSLRRKFPCACRRRLRRSCHCRPHPLFPVLDRSRILLAILPQRRHRQRACAILSREFGSCIIPMRRRTSAHWRPICLRHRSRAEARPLGWVHALSMSRRFAKIFRSCSSACMASRWRGSITLRPRKNRNASSTSFHGSTNKTIQISIAPRTPSRPGRPTPTKRPARRCRTSWARRRSKRLSSCAEPPKAST